MQNEYEFQQFFYDAMAGAGKGIINSAWQGAIAPFTLGIQVYERLNGVNGPTALDKAIGLLQTPYRYSNTTQAIFGAASNGTTDIIGAYAGSTNAIRGAGGGGGSGGGESTTGGGSPRDFDALAHEYHGLLKGQSFKRTTTAVAGALTSEGEAIVVVTNSSGRLSSAQRTMAQRLGHMPIEGVRFPNEHAEEIMFRLGGDRGYNFVGRPIGVSHPAGICLRCEQSVRVVHRMNNHSPYAGKPLGSGAGNWLYATALTTK